LLNTGAGRTRYNDLLIGKYFAYRTNRLIQPIAVELGDDMSVEMCHSMFICIILDLSLIDTTKPLTIALVSLV